MNSLRYRSRPSYVSVTVLGLVLIILLGGLDYVTGPQISFSVFYLLPISLVTWFTNQRGGMVSALISAIVWLIADLTSAAAYNHPFIPFWNAIVRLLVFVTIVYLESALRDLNHGLEQRVVDRTALLENEVGERKKVEEQLQRYAERLETLRKIDHAILMADSLDAVAQAAIQQVAELLHCDRVTFLLFDFDARQIVLFEAVGTEPEAEFSKRSIAMNELAELNEIMASLGQTPSKSKVDLLSHPHVPALLKALAAEQDGSVLVVPISVQSDLIGSLNLIARQPNLFSEEHVEIGQEAANQLGIAIKQARMVDQLRQHQESLQVLSQRLLDVQETERRGIARELHDEIGQALTGLRLMLEVAAQQNEGSVPAKLNQARLLVEDLMERVSQLSLNLRPALLDDLGLLPTLLWHMDRYTSQTGIEANLKQSGLEGQRFSPEVETAAYRIVQEALTNIARYAQVDQANVTLWVDQTKLGIQVEDKGQGFDPKAALAKGSSSGLLGMQERAILLNGTFTVESSPEQGTRLLAELPVNTRELNLK